jgi:Rieske Fe-S protein
MSERKVDRRTFAGLLVGGFVSACLSGCATVAPVSVRREGGEVRLRLQDHPELTRANGSLRIRVDETGELFYVLRQRDDSVLAVSPLCTHQGCTVNIAGPYLECPCHGSVYDLEGKVLRGPADRPLRSLPARVLGDVLAIRIRDAA